MENLYKSLFVDVNQNEDDINAINFDLGMINKISGQYDTNSLSRYFTSIFRNIVLLQIH